VRFGPESSPGLWLELGLRIAILTLREGLASPSMISKVELEPSSWAPHEWMEAKFPMCPIETVWEDITELLAEIPQTFGKALTKPARIAGIQAHVTAAVVSKIDQKVVGTLSHVGSAVRPKFRRLQMRMIDIIQTLW
jgi:hypothetical protein